MFLAFPGCFDEIQQERFSMTFHRVTLRASEKKSSFCHRMFLKQLVDERPGFKLATFHIILFEYLSFVSEEKYLFFQNYVVIINLR